MAARTEAPNAHEAKSWRAAFLVAGLYDVILGATFFLLWKPIFRLLHIERPKNTSYIHISAALVFVQGISYWFVARNLTRNVDIVRVGTVYKTAYIAVAAYYLTIGKLLHSIFAWFALFDLGFLFMFLRFLQRARTWEQLKDQEGSTD